MGCFEWKAGTGCVLHPGRTTLGFPPALRQFGADRAGDNGLDGVLSPKHTCQRFEMHKVHRKASWRDAMSCANPSVPKLFLPVSHLSQMPISLTCSSPSPHPYPLFFVFLPSGAPAHQTCPCSVFLRPFLPPAAVRGWSGCPHTQNVKPLNGFCAPEASQSKQSP